MNQHSQPLDSTTTDAEWLSRNGKLLSLLRERTPPTLKSVLDLAKTEDFDLNLLDNMILLSTLNKLKAQDEYCAYHVVAEHLSAKIIAGASNPDLITRDGYPVEVKVGIFNDSSLKQLQRYMLKLGASKGIACASKLSTALPDNISFVQIRFDSNSNEYVICGYEVAE